jgi:Uma2 family endonuclease
MATQPTTGLTYRDLQAFPDDNFRRELIDGELVVTPAPATRHQRVVALFTGAFLDYEREHGGQVFPAPTDVFFSDTNVVEPDVLFVRAENLHKVEKRFVRSAPDVVVEVSSPSTRRLELGRKLALYERFGVPEYWYVDLEAERLEIHGLAGDRYEPPRILGCGDLLTSPILPDFSFNLALILQPASA